MKKNMGSLDRTARMILGIVFLAAILAEYVTGTAAWLLGIVAAAFIITSLISSCPLYMPFRINTMKKSEK